MTITVYTKRTHWNVVIPNVSVLYQNVELAWYLIVDQYPLWRLCVHIPETITGIGTNSVSLHNGSTLNHLKLAV